MIGLSDNQLEVIMRVAAPLSEEKCQEFFERVAAVLQVRGQINDDDVAAAVQLALGALIRNSAAWKNWNRNWLPTRQDGQGFDAPLAGPPAALTTWRGRLPPRFTKFRNWATSVFADALAWGKNKYYFE
jgi:hypothetical protein